ncbi:MAG: hypothetical protein J1E35_03975 [Lachnospiraceae bacterium]|nr:hypothetical protein [Lachnospiraceae bacterium]
MASAVYLFFRDKGLITFFEQEKLINIPVSSESTPPEVSNSQRNVFPGNTALLKTFYLIIFEVMKKWTMPIPNWDRYMGTEHHV